MHAARLHGYAQRGKRALLFDRTVAKRGENWTTDRSADLVCTFSGPRVNGHVIRGSME